MHMMPYHYGQFFGFGDLISIVIFIIIVGIVVRIFAGPRGHRHLRHWHSRSAALELLEERYVKGEITKEEFDTKKKDLTA